jgi:hypothetical protein
MYNGIESTHLGKTRQNINRRIGILDEGSHLDNVFLNFQGFRHSSNAFFAKRLQPECDRRLEPVLVTQHRNTEELPEMKSFIDFKDIFNQIISPVAEVSTDGLEESLKSHVELEGDSAAFSDVHGVLVIPDLVSINLQHQFFCLD